MKLFIIKTFFFSDVDSKLPEKLNLKFVHIRPDERYSALISILKYIVAEGSQTVVFVATQHHVELVQYVMSKYVILKNKFHFNDKIFHLQFRC